MSFRSALRRFWYGPPDPSPTDHERAWADPRVIEAKQEAEQLGLELRLSHQNTRQQLAGVVPVAGLDYWVATLHTADGERVADASMNESWTAARAVVAAYREGRPRPFDPPSRLGDHA